MSSAEAKAVSAKEAKALFADLASVPALILAVSGGPDSTALLVLMARWRASLKTGPALCAVTIDHGLRPESAAEAKVVARLARKLGVRHRTVQWKGRKPARGLQRAAREARYRLLAETAHALKARHIVTAHTLDDQAETVLLRLARGSGLTGLSGMARVSRLPLPERASREAPLLVRPFLGIPKLRLIATLRRLKLAFAEDPSNRDPRFTRARLRALSEALEEEGLSAERLSLLARRVRRSEMALDAMAGAAAAALAQRAAAPRDAIRFEIGPFLRLPEEIALRLLGKTIGIVGDEGPVELGKLESLWAALFDPQAKAPGGRRTLAGALVTCRAGSLLVERAPPRRRGRRAEFRP